MSAPDHVRAMMHRNAERDIRRRDAQKSAAQKMIDGREARYKLFIDCLPAHREFSASDTRSSLAAHPEGPWLSTAALYAYMTRALDAGVIRRIVPGKYVLTTREEK